jgi:hypothetical protein
LSAAQKDGCSLPSNRTAGGSALVSWDCKAGDLGAWQDNPSDRLADAIHRMGLLQPDFAATADRIPAASELRRGKPANGPQPREGGPA